MWFANFCDTSHFASQFLVVLGAWGGVGLELRTPVKIKTIRPAQAVHSTQKSKEQGNPNKKRTKWCDLILVPVVGLEPTTY